MAAFFFLLLLFLSPYFSLNKYKHPFETTNLNEEWNKKYVCCLRHSIQCAFKGFWEEKKVFTVLFWTCRTQKRSQVEKNKLIGEKIHKPFIRFLLFVRFVLSVANVYCLAGHWHFANMCLRQNKNGNRTNTVFIARRQTARRKHIFVKLLKPIDYFDRGKSTHMMVYFIDVWIYL